jgi:uncharacterized membrane protein required for colicin V production
MANLWQDLPRSFPIPGLQLAWIDQVAVLILIVFTLLGIRRGLWWQVIRLLGIVAAVALARGLSPRFTPALQRAMPEVSDSVAQGGVWFVLFLGGMVIASLLGLIGKRALETMQLGLFDRMGGAVAGAMSGALLHAVMLVVMITLVPQWSQRNLGGTRSAFLLEALVQKAHLMVDAQAAERMRPVIGAHKRGAGKAAVPTEPDGPR